MLSLFCEGQIRSRRPREPAAYACNVTGAGILTHDERLRQAWDADRQFPEALAAINRIAGGLRAEVHLHCSHSVYKRRSDVTGDYRPILPRLREACLDRVNLEFAYRGTGGISDLAPAPAHLGVGMGVVDVRTEAPQTVEEIEALGAAGASAIGAGRIALNPDCGFAPNAAEPPTIDEADEKLRRLSACGRGMALSKTTNLPFDGGARSQMSGASGAGGKRVVTRGAAAP